MNYKLERWKSEAITLKADDMAVCSVDVSKTSDDRVTMSIEDENSVVELIAPKDVLYEFISGVYNILTHM